ncbi:MAG: 30S ribosomal protein S5 [Bacilli bacterium]|nr:30S ribosomal protein S5 [Bacilli bacterium]
MNGKKEREQKKLYEDKIISIGRVVKVNKGGRNFRFSATVAVGDRKGKVGIGTGKSKEIPVAVSKAIKEAEKNLVNIDLVDGRTISHEAIGVCGAAKVLIRPAAEGRGIIAGGAARIVLELAGVRDVVSKSLGSNTQINTAKATIEALQNQRSVEHVAKLRGKTKEEVLG